LPPEDDDVLLPDDEPDELLEPELLVLLVLEPELPEPEPLEPELLELPDLPEPLEPLDEPPLRATVMSADRSIALARRSSWRVWPAPSSAPRRATWAAAPSRVCRPAKGSEGTGKADAATEAVRQAAKRVARIMAGS
jgi:hypothetical protein